MYHLGIDVGSVSTDIVMLDENMEIIEKIYLRTKGRPIRAIQQGFNMLKDKYKDEEIKSVGTTGSGRAIAGFLVGADSVKNEITAHAVAALELDKGVRTILEIGGQDSKIIILKDGIVTDFAMNTVCAAGTGSFLDRQAERLEIPIERFGEYALKSKTPVRIAGRCAVFAESDMIHKQQLGYDPSDIIRGLCEALVRNYLNNVGKGKEIESKIFFQGGVAANIGMKEAFERVLNKEVIIPPYYDVMGSIGAAIIGKETLKKKKAKTNFKGFNIADSKVVSESFQCKGCANRCEVVKILENGKEIGCFGDMCGKWTERLVV
ncbi:acyl-CoA dehydratase activase [Haloimpatiens lingqiaonensis]|uniref:acyl-CoA dehydratase activase n=1 Tax=Haloimpatiens lingqiaonensis TaxID=1380675 RepID=UPI0010FE9DD2|nr:acyl-CoA dehydratase activase [Haloimpatiens lingqiaonensis]